MPLLTIAPMDDYFDLTLFQCPSNFTAGVSLTLAGLTLLLILWGFLRIGGTTLMAPWAFCIAALLGIVIVEVLIGRQYLTPLSVAPLRYIAAAASFCPLVALLGARRPQNRAWPLIVLALWAVLASPAVFTLVVGRPFELDTLWWCFLLALIATVFLNGLFTSYSMPWTLVAMGQMFLFARQLPVLKPHFSVSVQGGELPTVLPQLLALYCFACAALAAHVLAFFRRRLVDRRQEPLDHLWLDYRDAFGLIWALRVREQVNQAAAQDTWPVRLRWNGFDFNHPPANTDPETAAKSPDDFRPALEQTLRNQLRRFVSPAWIEKRLQPPSHTNPKR